MARPATPRGDPSWPAVAPAPAAPVIEAQPVEAPISTIPEPAIPEAATPVADPAPAPVPEPVVAQTPAAPAPVADPIIVPAPTQPAPQVDLGASLQQAGLVLIETSGAGAHPVAAPEPAPVLGRKPKAVQMVADEPLQMVETKRD